MEVKINNKSCNVPTDLSQITLAKFLEYYNLHGRKLDDDLKAILEKEYTDEFEKEMDLSDHEDKEALHWCSFWTGFDLTTLGTREAIPLIILYRQVRLLLLNSENESMVLPEEIEWQNELWEIKDFKVTATSSFTFNELITSKEVMRQVKAIGGGRWDAMPYLCAVFLRKKGEKFSDSLVAADGERLKLFQQLTMDIVMKVAFFLTVSVITWKEALVYSKEHPELSNP
jgi:hypothetical protein